MRIISGRGSLAIVLSMLALFLRGSSLYATAYTNAAGDTVIVPNDADSPYTLADIAGDISNTNFFSYDAVSNIAVCSASLSISGTVHIGKVAAEGSYNPAGVEEKLLMNTNAKHQITINSGGVLIARGAQGVYGVRRQQADSLYNEISIRVKASSYSFQIFVKNGGMIRLYDTEVSRNNHPTSIGSSMLVDSSFDIQRCKLYTFTYAAVEFTVNHPAAKIFRDNYIGYVNASSPQRLSLCWRGVPYNNDMDIINCEFDASSGGELASFYHRGIRLIDCKFNYAPGSIYSTGGGPGQMEFRNCTFNGSRSVGFGGTGDTNEYALFTWYLSAHVVDRKRLWNIETGDNDITLVEQAGSNSIYKFTGGNWASPTSLVTIGTDTSGWTPSPTNAGAIMLTEMIQRRAAYGGTNYYRYNLKIAAQQVSARYFAYDYYAQYGGNYITSVDEGGAINDKCIGPGWFRQDAATPNPEPLLNEPPTNGTWYIGMQPVPAGTIFRSH